MNKSLRQGGVDSPWCWNLAVRAGLDMQAVVWVDKGIKLVGIGVAPIVSWADNLYFPAHTAAEALELLADFSKAPQTFGLLWKPSSLEILTSGSTIEQFTVDMGGRAFASHTFSVDGNSWRSCRWPSA